MNDASSITIQKRRKRNRCGCLIHSNQLLLLSICCVFIECVRFKIDRVSPYYKKKKNQMKSHTREICATQKCIRICLATPNRRGHQIYIWNSGFQCFTRHYLFRSLFSFLISVAVRECFCLPELET